MYPNRDFRYLINQPNVTEDDLILSLRREPLSEVLWYWQQSRKPIHLIKIYQKGIEEAIAKDRYPLYQLEDIKAYPEFLLPTLNGLKRLWLSLRFSLDRQSLLIDSIRGQNINISSEDKLKFLNILPYRSCCNISVDNQACITGVFTSRKAEQIYQINHSLERLLSQNKEFISKLSTKS